MAFSHQKGTVADFNESCSSNQLVLATKGTTENLMHEMAVLGINVLGISEIRWHGEGD